MMNCERSGGVITKFKSSKDKSGFNRLLWVLCKLEIFTWDAWLEIKFNGINNGREK